jgi:SAM-dependent methyltransferase
MRGEEMKEFWDDRAREDALFFVDNDLAYGSPDEERFWARGTQVVDEICELLGCELEASDRVVEIGCGVGRLTRELAGRTAHVDALDVSEQMLELARSYNPGLENVRWLQGDGESLAVDDASANVCFSHVVFQHIPDPAITLGYVREMGRVLADGGWAAFQISNQPRIHQRRGLGERMRHGLRSALGRGPRGQAHPAWRGSAVDLDDLRETASQAGMSVGRIVGEGTQFCFVRLERDPR